MNPMTNNLERNEGLRILARIIAEAYLADNQRNIRTTTRGRTKKDEDLFRASRNSPNRKRSH
jgi:hypothetical protein